MSARRQAMACCPACAASVRPWRRSHAPRAWLVLLSLLVATIPVAAFTAGDAPIASAASPPFAVQVPAPAVPTPPSPTIAERVDWQSSVAHGTANSGWLERGVVLPKQGPGFYTYDPYTQQPFNRSARRHGTDMLVRELVNLGIWWQRTTPRAPRLGIGDLSINGGGSFDLHASHENGLDVDIRLPRADGREGPAHPGNYDLRLTQKLVDRLVARGAQYVLYGPSLSVTGPPGVVMIWPNHDDHLHVRFPDPDGLGN